MGKTGKNSKSKYYLDLQNKVYPKGFFPIDLDKIRRKNSKNWKYIGWT